MTMMVITTIDDVADSGGDVILLFRDSVKS